MSHNPEEDGITHINMYSKGRTEFGRMLSNFYRFPIHTQDGNFLSVEGYWYWLSISDDVAEKEQLRELFGFEAKKIGKSILTETNNGKNSRFDENFESKISNAIWYKVKRNSGLLIPEYYDLPIVHYYSYNGKIKDMTNNYQWMMKNLNIMRKMIIEKKENTNGKIV